jgi:hypothetical protein
MAALTASADTQMTERLAAAELVVTGVASEPRPFTPRAMAVLAEGEIPRLSEHDPDWWSTTITVDSVEKGDASGNTTEIVFANSHDIAWYRAPKVKAGDRGVWLLHNRDHRGKAVPALAITHPLDFHPESEAPRLRALLKQ